MNEPSKQGKFLSIRFRPWDFITACGAVLAACTIVGFFGSGWWFFDLFSNFRIQYFFGLLIVSLLLLIPRRKKPAGVFGGMAFVNLCVVLPVYFGAEPTPLAHSRAYRALLMNVNTEHGKPDKVAQAIQRYDPDFFILEEINQHWLDALAGALTRYPYRKVVPREDNFGIGLFCKYPLSRADIRELGNAEVPSVVAEINLPDRLLTVIGTHPLPPGGGENSQLRNEQLESLPALVKEATSPILLMGDLNTTPWSSHFKRLLADTGLRDSSRGRGILATWPTYVPPMLIPIDHCLCSKGIHVTMKKTGDSVGSDHYPVEFEFVLTTVH